MVTLDSYKKNDKLMDFTCLSLGKFRIQGYALS